MATEYVTKYYEFAYYIGLTAYLLVLFYNSKLRSNLTDHRPYSEKIKQYIVRGYKSLSKNSTWKAYKKLY